MCIMNKNRQSDDNKNSLLVHQNWMNDWQRKNNENKLHRYTGEIV